MAKGDFAEATVGCTDLEIGKKWVSCFNTSDFKVDPVTDVAGAELCGALKARAAPRPGGLLDPAPPCRLAPRALPPSLRRAAPSAALPPPGRAAALYLPRP